MDTLSLLPITRIGNLRNECEIWHAYAFSLARRLKFLISKFYSCSLYFVFCSVFIFKKKKALRRSHFFSNLNQLVKCNWGKTGRWRLHKLSRAYYERVHYKINPLLHVFLPPFKTWHFFGMHIFWLWLWSMILAKYQPGKHRSK